MIVRTTRFYAQTHATEGTQCPCTENPNSRRSARDKKITEPRVTSCPKKHIKRIETTTIAPSKLAQRKLQGMPAGYHTKTYTNTLPITITHHLRETCCPQEEHRENDNIPEKQNPLQHVPHPSEHRPKEPMSKHGTSPCKTKYSSIYFYNKKKIKKSDIKTISYVKHPIK